MQLCDVIGRPDLKDDARCSTMGGRVALGEEVDAAIQPWISAHAVDDCVQRFSAAGIACGPVFAVTELFADVNLASRKTFLRLRDPQSGADLTVPAALIRGSRAGGGDPQSIPALNWSDAKFRRPAPSAKIKQDRGTMTGSALTGVRVVEMGIGS